VRTGAQVAALARQRRPYAEEQARVDDAGCREPVADLAGAGAGGDRHPHRGALSAAEGLKEHEHAEDERCQDGQREEAEQAPAHRAARAGGAAGHVCRRGHHGARKCHAAHAADADRALGLVVERAGRRGGWRGRVGLDAAHRPLATGRRRHALAARAAHGGLGSIGGCRGLRGTGLRD